MASSKLNAIISFFFLSLAIQSATADETQQLVEKPVVDVAVEGVVYCQSCDGSGAKTIELATISVICKDHRNRVSFYKPFQTDKNGYFFATLKGLTMSHPVLDHPLHSCKVKLVSCAPEDICSLPTNLNNGLYGAPLRYEDKRVEASDYEAVVYAAGPLAFRPANCDYKALP